MGLPEHLRDGKGCIYHAKYRFKVHWTLADFEIACQVLIVVLSRSELKVIWSRCIYVIAVVIVTVIKQPNGPHELHSDWWNRRLIVDYLKLADDITIPPLFPSAWLERTLRNIRATGEQKMGPQLAIAGRIQLKLKLMFSVEELWWGESQAAASVSRHFPNGTCILRSLVKPSDIIMSMWINSSCWSDDSKDVIDITGTDDQMTLSVITSKLLRIIRKLNRNLWAVFKDALNCKMLL